MDGSGCKAIFRDKELAKSLDAKTMEALDKIRIEISLREVHSRLYLLTVGPD
jgi:hypothetical protein